MPERPSLRLLLLAVLLSGCVSSGGAPPPASAAPGVSGVASLPPAPSASPASTPMPSATAGGPASGVPSASPSASPSADPSALELTATSCRGGVLLEWSASVDPDFHHYTALRSPEREIKPNYPPIAPAVDWGDTYATDRFMTSAVDASIIPSARTWFYRIMAYDADNRVVGSSQIREARLLGVEELGGLEADAADADTTHLTWGGYDGFSGCFSSYRILYGTSGIPSTVLATISDDAVTELETDALRPGTTYLLRVQAVRVTALGSFVLGQTDVVSYSVP